MANNFTVKINPAFKGRGGVAGAFTWQRLEKILRNAGELRDNETIEGYEVSEANVNFYIKRVDKS